MKIPEVKLGYTYRFDTEELSGFIEPSLIIQNSTKFVTVELKLCGSYETHEFSELNSALEHSNNRDLVYRFIEYTDPESRSVILFIRYAICDNIVLGFKNGSHINKNWKLYINSKNDITVQHVNFPKSNITVRFRNFPAGNNFYVYLSCLIYTLTNYKIETGEEIRNAFNKVKNHMEGDQGKVTVQ